MPKNVTPGRPQEPGSQDGGDYGTYQGGSSSSGGEGCAPGLIQTGLNAQGQPGGDVECVTPEEADKRRNLHSPGWESGGGITEPGQGGGGPAGGGPLPPFAPNYGKAPMFTAPKFEWNRKFTAPTEQEAYNDPGYQFGLNQSLGAYERSAAARGNLRTGGTAKGLTKYANDIASQRYGDVYGRRLGEYGMEYGQAKDKFGFDYTGARDEYAPKLTEWLQKNNAANIGNQNQWTNYWGNNLTAAQLLALLGGYGA